MKYSLALDCGGTKALAVLYDPQYRPVRVGRAGSIRSTTMPREYIQQNITLLLQQLQLQGLTLSLVSGVTETALVSAIQSVCTVERVRTTGELELGLAAAGVQEGYLGVSGTGANLCCRYQGKTYSVGGYGPIVSDAGSGYWIAREAFEAAIRDSEQRGAHTQLTRRLARRLVGGDREQLRRAIFSIYADPKIPPLAKMTDCAEEVSLAAAQGDAVACDILLRAARVLAEQTNSLRIVNDLPARLPVTVSGGVWRGHPMIFEEYCRFLREKGMTGPFLWPDFAPVVGAILEAFVQEHGALTGEDRERFRTLYQQYRF